MILNIKNEEAHRLASALAKKRGESLTQAVISALREQLMLQGVLIGVVGTALGLVAGYSLCYLADHYHWLKLDEQVYALSYVPFAPSATHGIWIAAAAILVSFLATIYPARSATRIAPAEVLRYE